MSSAPNAPLNEGPAPIPDFWIEIPKPLPTELGTHRINWNFRHDNPPAFSHNYDINANPGETPASPEGPLVSPGIYTLTLTVDGRSYMQTLKVLNDPRSPASNSDLRSQTDLKLACYEGVQEAWDGYQQVTKVRASVAGLLKTRLTKEVQESAEAFDAKLALVGGSGAFGRRFGGGRPPVAAPTFAAVHGTMLRLMSTLDSGDMRPNEPTLAACKAADKDLATIRKAWTKFQEQDWVEFNKLLEKNGLKAIAID
jgi:hypothetical protein